MNWDQIQANWKQTKEAFVFRRFRKTDGNRRGPDLSSANMAGDRQNDVRPTAFRPDDRGKRSEFSLHIGC
jgi:hypothetical protein